MSSLVRMDNRALVLRASDFLEAVHRTVTGASFVHPTEKYEKTFADTVGHFLRFGPSTISEAGDGAFLFEGEVLKGGIVTLFPGLVHSKSKDVSSDDSWPPQVGSSNPYVLRESQEGNDYVIDGRPNGQSAVEFVQALHVAKKKGIPANHSWIDEPNLDIPDPTPLHPLPSTQNSKGGATMGTFASRVAFQEALLQCSLGHKLNRPVEKDQANVTFQMVSLPGDFPDDLLQYVPCLNASLETGVDRWAVVVQATKDLDVKKDGPMELFMEF
ncbi:hypothetical protein BSKO_09461 [Bryopsis sp. KO-2023]|nr:hypothetical protein BSKO_09461 [Bryopsis sp. KO-2023]